MFIQCRPNLVKILFHHLFKKEREGKEGRFTSS